MRVMTDRDTLRLFSTPREPVYCRAVIDNTAARCSSRPELGRAVCTKCRVRIHSAMAATLYKHGAFGLAAEIDLLYRAEYGKVTA